MAANSDTAAFTLDAGPNTDIWRKPGHNVWSAPITISDSGPLKAFLSARVTFGASWTSLYDQAGLLLVPRRASDLTSPPAHWVKAGVEFYDNKPHLSVVTCDRYADWGLYPLTGDPAAQVTLEVSRDGGPKGKNAWVHRLLLDGEGNVRERIPLRKICWIFADEDEGDWVLDVSPLVARPAKDVIESLQVEFSEFKVVWAQ